MVVITIPKSCIKVLSGIKKTNFFALKAILYIPPILFDPSIWTTVRESRVLKPMCLGEMGGATQLYKALPHL